MSAFERALQAADEPLAKRPIPIAENRISQRVASIDWMRGLVMVLMIIDHASMAFDAHHLDHDSAMYPDASTMALPGAEFFPRWLAHLCAASFVFLMGASLALSVERRVVKGVNALEIDKSILTRGGIIALFDLTLISFGSGRWTFGVLMAIGVSMICMALLRRLPTWALLAMALGWMAFGEIVTGWFWTPPGNSSKLAAFMVANYSSPTIIFKYPILPWLAITILGWVFGRHLIRFAAGQSEVSGKNVLWISGTVGLLIFAVVRGIDGYGNMFLHRADNSWQQWLHVSKYPPSLAYFSLELGILCLCLALLRTIEVRIGVRENGVFYVFGQTAMFYYLVHRLLFETPATYFGLRGFDGLAATFGVAAVMLVLLYPICRSYRAFKALHPGSILRYV
jgi:uncharacterized membrane protein